MEIKARFTNRVIYTSEKQTMREAVEDAVRAKVSLRSADLRSAYLQGADLRSAYLRSAYLRSADLRSADLRSADLQGADLRSADLQGADLRSADLQGAYLQGADLRSADLRSAYLQGAYLQPIKQDFFEVLLAVPNEIALVEGRVNGRVYEGDCACLVGTIANLRKCEYTKIEGLAPQGSRPIERFFLGIETGDTPADNQFSKIAVDWIDEFSSKLDADVASRSTKEAG
ncbi:MAG: pentapeptide repeat-containing protein [Ktedonobacteraceae bacterium]